MKLITIIATSLSLVFSTYAGESTILGMPEILPPVESNSYLGVKSQYMFNNDSHDSEVGVEVSIGVNVYEYVNLQVSAGVLNTDSAIQNYTFDVVAVCPEDLTFLGVGYSPYILLGGGVYTNSDTAALARFGGGVNLDIPNTNTSLFMEGVYNLVGNDVENYSTAGIGLRVKF